jgi:CheY-like chemotaxis protein/two-component sensor histidine kinase
LCVPFTNLQNRNVRKDGSEIIPGVERCPCAQGGGTLCGYRGVDRDVTNRAKNEFLANMSHEIRTPLAGVFALTELLLKQELSESLREDLNMIHSSARSVLTLVNDLLDLSRIEKGTFELSITHCFIIEYLESLVRPYEVQANEKQISFELFVGTNVPEQVLCDQDRLGQVLKNLLFNAIKFTEAGTVRLEVNTEEQSGQPPLLRFTVSDTGIGIPEDKIGALFQQFTQLDPSYSKRYAGAGLGLAISKNLVELMGGAISVESEKGKGSTFEFTVAFQKAESGLCEKLQPSLNLHDLPRLSILVAEDNPVNRLFMKRALTGAGHRVKEAADGFQALEETAAGGVDLLLMDIQMPGMDGLEATRKIRSGSCGKPDIPIIALTAYAMRGDREKFMSAGMDGYVTKPVDFGELARVIAEVCGVESMKAP